MQSNSWNVLKPLIEQLPNGKEAITTAKFYELDSKENEFDLVEIFWYISTSYYNGQTDPLYEMSCVISDKLKYRPGLHCPSYSWDEMQCIMVNDITKALGYDNAEN